MRYRIAGFIAVIISALMFMALFTGCPAEKDTATQTGDQPLQTEEDLSGQSGEELSGAQVEDLSGQVKNEGTPSGVPGETVVEGTDIPANAVPENMPEPGTPAYSIAMFFNALADADFATAKTYATPEFWVEGKFQETEDSWPEMLKEHSEEELKQITSQMRLDAKRYEQLAAATTKIEGNNAVLTIHTGENETDTMFEFTKMDGIWKIKSGA